MKINYFSPLSPAQSGISDVAGFLIPALSQYAEVCIWTDQDHWNSALEKYAKIYQYDPNNIVWSLLNNADVNIYHLGNNIRYHRSILSISQQVPGIVVLHDIRLYHLFNGFYCTEKPQSESYVFFIEKYYGREASTKARRCLIGEIPIAEMEDYAMTEWAIENASAVMVHSRESFTDLAQQHRWPIAYQPLVCSAPPLLSESHTKTASPYRLIIFGYIGHNRRIESALQALSELPNKAKFQLDIYGSVNDESRLRQQIEQYNLKSHVKVHGFVSDEVLDRALANSHLAINLRYPTMGEASGSLLRIWRHALPSLVTKVGWYAEQSEEAVLFVRPEQEIDDIKRHLQRLVDNPESLTAMGLRGRQILEEFHSPDAYARALIEFAKALPIGYQQANMQYWVRRVGKEMAHWQVPSLGENELCQIANAIHFLGQ